MIWLRHHVMTLHEISKNCRFLTALSCQHTKHPLKVAQKQRKTDLLKEKLRHKNATSILNQTVPKIQPSKKMISLSNNNTLY